MAKGKGGFIGQDGLNAPDSPTAVSGTAGDSSVSVAFTAPTDVGGSAITGYNVQSNNGDGTWQSFSDSSYDNKSFSTASQDSSPEEVRFKPDGTKFYILGYTNDTVYQYAMSTAWDVSTASYESKSFSVASQESNPQALAISSDGTKFYVAGQTDYVYQYTLSSAYDASTASYANKSFSTASQISGVPWGVDFDNTGAKMYVIGSGGSVFQYTLSTPWDVSTASYASKTLDTTTQTSDTTSVAISSDGLSLFVVSNGNDTVFKYTLSTAFDLSTASYSNESLNVSSQENVPYGVAVKVDGSKLYVTGNQNDSVQQYTISDFDYPTASPVTVYGLTNGTSYTFSVWAINAFGYSAPSDASTGVSPSAPRALIGSGIINSTTIEFVTISSAGNAQDFGDLTVGRGYMGASSSSTRSVFGGGYAYSVNVKSNVMDYVTIASTGNATDFGDLTDGRNSAAACGNATRGIWAGGEGSSNPSNIMDYITIASAGNASDFGDLSVARITYCGAAASPTRGVWLGGQGSNSGVVYNTIDYVTIGSTGNASDFGDLSATSRLGSACSSNTRAVHHTGILGGSVVNTLEYITIGSTGNSTDFGDLYADYGTGSTSNSTKGIYFGGASATYDNAIHQITIASTGNSTDFGDLTYNATQRPVGTSGEHGGLS